MEFEIKPMIAINGLLIKKEGNFITLSIDNVEWDGVGDFELGIGKISIVALSSEADMENLTPHSSGYTGSMSVVTKGNKRG